MYRGGLNYMRYSVSDTAEHGDYTAGPRLVTDRDQGRRCSNMLDEIQDGTYAQAWIDGERQPGARPSRRRAAAEQTHPIEQVGARLRAMMPFLDAVTVTRRGAAAATALRELARRRQSRVRRGARIDRVERDRRSRPAADSSGPMQAHNGWTPCPPRSTPPARPLRSLRVSVTDRCNIRCAYCMPEADYIWLPREHLLSFEEIGRLVDVFAARSASTACA